MPKTEPASAWLALQNSPAILKVLLNAQHFNTLDTLDALDTLYTFCTLSATTTGFALVNCAFFSAIQSYVHE